MKLVIPGGSGNLGHIVRRHLEPKGWQIVVFTRRPDIGKGEIFWDGETLGPWTSELEDADVVLNLAGRSVNCRYNVENLKEMFDSRLISTRVIGEAIRAASRPPRRWLQASTATIYAHRYDAPNDELTGIMATERTDAPTTWQKSVELANAWEHELDSAATPDTTKVAMRISIVMSKATGGAFDTMATLARRGLLGIAGNGRQYVSWIHEADFARAVEFLIDNETLSGAINLASPNPMPNAEFNRFLRRSVGAKFGPPVPAPILEIGAYFLKTETELILKSRRVVPTRLLEAGFKFEFPDWEAASKDLASRWIS